METVPVFEGGYQWWFESSFVALLGEKPDGRKLQDEKKGGRKKRHLATFQRCLFHCAGKKEIVI